MTTFTSFKHSILAVTLASCVVAPLSAKEFSALYFVHGTLGDKSFMDSAQRGMNEVEELLGANTRTVEAGLDSTQWESAFRDVVEFDDYDVYVAVTYPMAAIVQELAQEYPDKKFILVDAMVNYDQCSNRCENVYSLLFKQNEAAYLAGVYAAEMTQSRIPRINPDKNVLGIVGGQEVPVIKDFVMGFEQGAKSVSSDTRVIVQYANSWTDPAKGKEIAKTLYSQGADIVFSVAGGTGQGVFEAARESDKYAIGVDADQFEILKDASPEQAELILTSVMKNVDAGLALALTRASDGTLVWGKADYIGISEGAVGLAKNTNYIDKTPKDIQLKIEDIQRKIVNNKIEIDSAF